MDKNQQIFHLLKNTTENIERFANNSLKKHGLTLSQGHILKFLTRQQDNKATLKEIEKNINVAQSTVFGLVSRLEKKGFVSTSHDITDKRIKIVTLTTVGCDSICQLKCIFEEICTNALKDLTDVEQILFIELLKKVYNNTNI